MGLLTEVNYWRDALNQLSQFLPPIGQAVTQENAVSIRTLACTSLTNLINDAEFEADIAAVISKATEASSAIDAVHLASFRDFLEMFMALEVKLLRDAGVNSAAANDLDLELRLIAKTPAKDRLERLADKVRYCASLACNAAMPESPDKIPLWKAALRGVQGVAVIGVDVGSSAGAACLLGPAGAAAVGTLAGISAGYGAALVHEAIKGRW